MYEMAKGNIYEGIANPALFSDALEGMEEQDQERWESDEAHSTISSIAFAPTVSSSYSTQNNKQAVMFVLSLFYQRYLYLPKQPTDIRHKTMER